MQQTEIDLGIEYNDLTERQREFVSLAAMHADDFATRAAEHDREGSFPFENFEKLHESGYARLCLPEQFKGRDANMEEFSLAQERLAYGCASTALSANMHGFGTGVWTELFKKGDQTFMMPIMAASQGVTLGGALSEAESADPFNFPAGRVERVDGGYRLNGRKVFGSNTPINPMLFFNGVLEENGDRKIAVFSVPKGHPGATVIEDWDTLGMRGTGSYTIEFKDCVVPEVMKVNEAPSGGNLEDSPFAATFVTWFGPTVGAVYLGIAGAARNAARSMVGERKRLPYGPVKHTAAVQYTLAEMYITLETARAMVRRSARRLSDPNWRDADAVALSVAARHVGTSSAQRVVDLAMELAGGGAFFRKLPFERWYRDVRAGGFHPPNRYDAMEFIGKAELGIPVNTRPRFV